VNDNDGERPEEEHLVALDGLRDREAASERSLAPSLRQEQIAEYVIQHGQVSAKKLAEMFNVSLMTIHRDLDELERQGILRKLRGYATTQPSSVFESNVRYRLTTAQAEKEAIARRAVELIEPGQVVMLDDSTSALHLARLLPQLVPLTVITNFLAIIKELAPVKGLRLIALGGEYTPSHDSFNGIVCTSAIESLRADIFFGSVSAIADGIAFHQEQEIVVVKQAMMRSSKTKVLLADHNKFHRTALHKLAPLEAFDLVILDSGVDPDIPAELRKEGIHFEIVEVAGG